MNDKNYCGIYKITSPSGKIYIGQTVKSRSRYSDYKRIACEKQRLLFSSLKKYGFDSHVLEMIHVLDTTSMSKIDIVNELNRLEIHYIEFYNSFKDNNENGMNLNKGGNVNQTSQETRCRMSLSSSGKITSQETKDKISKANKGKKRTQEDVEIIRKNSTGRKRSEESKKKMSEIMTGKVFSEEHKKNISKAKKGVKSKKPRSKETRLKMSLVHKGKKKSPEAVKKSADSKRGKKQSEEARLKKSIASKGERNPNYGKKRSPEINAKIVASFKRNRALIEEEKRMMIF